jgi:hypothetical protein
MMGPFHFINNFKSHMSQTTWYYGSTSLFQRCHLLVFYELSFKMIDIKNPYF